MRSAVTTIQLRLRVSVYRILYAMGGVEVLAVEDLPDPATTGGTSTASRSGLLAVKLRLSSSMLAFALEMAGPEQQEQSEPAKIGEEPVVS